MLRSATGGVLARDVGEPGPVAGEAMAETDERGATLRRVIDQWFHRGGVAPEQVMEMGNTEAIKKLVQAGLGVSVTSWFAAKSEARSGALIAIRLDPPLHRQLGIVRRRDKVRTPSLEAFLAALEDLRAQLDRDRARRRTT